MADNVVITDTKDGRLEILEMILVEAGRIADALEKLSETIDAGVTSAMESDKD